jgi:hypothetical protein
VDKSERRHTENHDVHPFEGSFDCVVRKMVRPERFELPTYSSGGCRSIQLSYGRATDSSSVYRSHGRLNDWGQVGTPVETRVAASCMQHRWRRGKPRLYDYLEKLQSSFDCRHRTSLPLIRLQNLLAQPQRLRGNFNELVVSNELNRLFEIEITIRHQANRFVGS